MSDHHDVKAEVRRYMLIFAALIIGTILTVAAAKIHFGSTTANIVVALIIAGIKAFLVAGFFMHLWDEKKMIYAVLGATVFFFAGLMFLTIWSMLPDSLPHIAK